MKLKLRKVNKTVSHKNSNWGGSTIANFDRKSLKTKLYNFEIDHFDLNKIFLIIIKILILKKNKLFRKLIKILVLKRFKFEKNRTI